MGRKCGEVNGLLLEGWKIIGVGVEGRLGWEGRKWGWFEIWMLIFRVGNY